MKRQAYIDEAIPRGVYRHLSDGVPGKEMESLRHVGDRGSRCYELAWKVILDEPGAEKFTLVHGQFLLGHAWIETGDGMVYDTTSDDYTPVGVYQGKAEFRYSRFEAAGLAFENNNTGPWHSHIYGVNEDDAEVIAGFLLQRGKKGFDAYDANKQYLGNFPEAGPSWNAPAAIFAASPKLCAWLRTGKDGLGRYPLPVAAETAANKFYSRAVGYKKPKPIKCLKRVADLVDEPSEKSCK